MGPDSAGLGAWARAAADEGGEAKDRGEKAGAGPEGKSIEGSLSPGVGLSH